MELEPKLLFSTRDTQDVLDTCFSRVDVVVDRRTSTALRRDAERRSINLTVNFWLSCRRHNLRRFFTSFSPLCSGDFHNPCWWDHDLFHRPIDIRYRNYCLYLHPSTTSHTMAADLRLSLALHIVSRLMGKTVAPKPQRRIHRCRCATVVVSDRSCWGRHGCILLVRHTTRLWTVGCRAWDRVLERWRFFFNNGCRLHLRSVVHEGDGAEGWWLVRLAVDYGLASGVGTFTGRRVCKARTCWK